MSVPLHERLAPQVSASSEQVTVVPAQTPAPSQRSPWLHASPSSQAVSVGEGAIEQLPDAGTQVLTRQSVSDDGSQVTTVAGSFWQVKAGPSAPVVSQTNVPSHRLSSSQSASVWHAPHSRDALRSPYDAPTHRHVTAVGYRHAPHSKEVAARCDHLRAEARAAGGAEVRTLLL